MGLQSYLEYRRNVRRWHSIPKPRTASFLLNLTDSCLIYGSMAPSYLRLLIRSFVLVGRSTSTSMPVRRRLNLAAEVAHGSLLLKRFTNSKRVVFSETKSPNS